MALEKQAGRILLCALDLSPASRAVAAWARALARLTQTRLCLFHAIHTASDALHPTAEFERGGDLSQRREKSRRQMARLMRDAQVPWQSEIVFGEPVEEILRFTRSNDVWMAVAGCRGLKGIQRLLFGDVIERLARASARPLFIVGQKATEDARLRRIGICCGFHRGSQVLINLGAELAALFQSDIAMIHAMESATAPSQDETAAGPYHAVQQRMQDNLKNRLIDLLPEAIRSRLSCRAHIVTGTARDRLPQLAADIGADLIVVGVRRHNMMEKLVLGSVTEAMLRKSPCHLLTVPIPFPGRLGRGLESAGKGRTGVVRDERFLDHRYAAGHHENQERLARVYAYLDKTGQDLPLIRIVPRHATRRELALAHTHDYIRRIEATAGGGDTLLTADTYAGADSYDTARLAAGAVLEAIDAVLDNRARNAFVLARPPGHHAERSRAMGFCLFNNAAIGARYACLQKGLAKVLLVDWDVHHGNGIQHTLEQDPRILYFSTHQYPHFPGTGHFLDIGRGPGEGFTFNVPLGRGWRDGDLVLLYQRLLAPVAEAFKPDLILVAAGFDLHRKDPLGKMKITRDGFAALTRLVMQLAARCCRDRLVLVLEGGYHHKSLAASVGAVLAELANETYADLDMMAARAKARRVDPVVKKCASVMGRFWPCLLEPPKTGPRRLFDDHHTDKAASPAGLSRDAP